MKNREIHIVALWCVVVSATACPDLHVWNGVITLSENATCKVSVPGHSISSTGRAVPGLWFGLIRLDCGPSCVKLVDSPFRSCPSCLLCIERQVIPECYSFVIPVVVCSLVTGLISALSLFVCMKVNKRHHLVERLALGVEACLANRKQHANERRVRKYLKVQACMRAAATTQATPSVGIDISAVPEAELVTPEEDQQHERLVVKPGRCIANHLLYVSIISLCSTQTLACTDTIMLTSEGLACTPRGCAPVSSYIFSLHPGGMMCLISDTAPTITIEVNDLKWLHSYEHSYSTSSYNLTSESVNRCLQAGECDTYGSCTPSSRHSSFKLKKVAGELDGYGCSIQTGTNSGCFYNQQCVWIHWTLTADRTGGIHDVYRHVMSQWTVTLTIKEDGDTRMVELTQTEPTTTLPRPLSVLAVPDDLLVVPEHLISGGDGKLYPIDASPRGSPIANMIGDLQFDMHGNVAFPIHTISCSYSGNYHMCKTIRPKLLDFKPDHRTAMAVQPHVGMMDLIRKAKGLITLSFSFPDKMHKLTQPSQCSFRFGTVTGCLSCGPIFAKLVVTPYNITKPGLMSVESNCSLETTMLLCAPDTYEISMLTKLTECCYVKTDRQNKHTICPSLIFMANITEISLLTTSQGYHYAGPGGFLNLLSKGNNLFTVVSPVTIISVLIAAFVAKLTLVVMNTRKG